MAFRAAPESGSSEQPSTSKVREMVEEEKKDDVTHAKAQHYELSSTDTDSDDESFTKALDHEGKEVVVARPRHLKKSTIDLEARNDDETQRSERTWDIPTAVGLVRRVPPLIQVERKTKQVSLDRIKARIARVTQTSQYFLGNLGASPPSFLSSSDSSDSDSPTLENDEENGNASGSMERLAEFLMGNPQNFRRSSSKVKIYKKVYFEG